MTKKRNNIVEKKKEKVLIPAPPGKKPPDVDVMDLPDAIVDGKLTVPLQGEVVVVRRMDGKKSVVSLCTVMKIEGSLVSTYDETQQKWYCFHSTEPGSHVIAIKRMP